MKVELGPITVGSSVLAREISKSSSRNKAYFLNHLGSYLFTDNGRSFDLFRVECGAVALDLDHDGRRLILDLAEKLGAKIPNKVRHP